MKNKVLKIKVNLKEYPIEVLRYAAYTLSGDFYIQLSPDSADKIEVSFEPKTEKSNLKKVPYIFKRELEDELIRNKIWQHNLSLREYLLMRSMAYQENMGPDAMDMKGLTPEQEKELEELINQVEEEIRKELKDSGESIDPLEIKKTWEEKYGDKIKEKFNKKIN